MPHNETTVHYLLTEHGIDASKVRGINPGPGMVLVEMLPESKRVGELWIPDTVAGKYRPDICVVLATGPDVSAQVGGTFVVRPYDGEWIEGFEVPGCYGTKNQVRLIGRTTPIGGEIDTIIWWESMPVQIVIEDEEPYMVATGKSLIIRRDPVVDQELGFDLPAQSTYRTGLATVISIGPDCDLATRIGDVQVGDRIHYNQEATLDFAFGDDPDLAIIPDLAVNFSYFEESAA